MPAQRRGESAAGLLFLVVVLVALVRGCGSAPRREPPRRDPAEVQRMHDLSRSVDALRSQNAELMAAHQEALREAARARRAAGESSAAATSGLLSYGLVGGVLLIVSGALSTALFALRRRRKGGPHG